MRAILTSLGSMGDIQPMLALAKSLEVCGHDVILAMPPNYEWHARRLGIEFRALGPPITGDILRTAISEQRRHSDPLQHAMYFLERVAPFVHEMFEQLEDLCRGADVLVSTPYQPAARMVHDAAGIRYVSVHLSPFGIGSPHHLKEASRPILNECRRREGLRDLDDPLGSDAASQELAIRAVSSLICRPDATSAVQKVTGFFFLEETSMREPGLVHFLNEGPAPLVITFGSMVQEDTVSTAQLLAEASIASGHRAVVQVCWEEDRLKDLQALYGDRIYFAGYLPHSWLFSSAKIAIHHGGAGTTAAALRSGVPSIVVPHVLDQPIWAGYTHSLGCTAAVIPRADLTLKSLSGAIQKACSSDRWRERALQVRERIRSESGADGAADLIEKLILPVPTVLSGAV